MLGVALLLGGLVRAAPSPLRSAPGAPGASAAALASTQPPPRSHPSPSPSAPPAGQSIASCPSFQAYRDAAAAAHVMALAPPAEVEEARRSYAAALQRVRAALPSAVADVDTWDRIESQWAAQVQARDTRAPLPLRGGTPFADPAFADAVDHIEEAMTQACVAGGDEE